MSDRRDPEFRVDALAGLRAQFVSALEADLAAPETTSARARKRRLGSRPAWAGALVAAAAVLLIGFFLLQGASVETVQEATATVADTALEAAYPPDDWYTYTEESLTSREYSARRGGSGRVFMGPGFTLREHRRSWLSVGRDGVIISQVLPPRSDTVIARVPAYAKYRIGNERYTRKQIDAFAVDPQPLIDAINAEAGSQRPGYQAFTKWDTITQALRDSAAPLPPAVRSALIRELATIPGVHVVHSDTDPLGRPAIGLYFDFQQLRDTVYFDKSSSVLGWEGKTALVEGFGVPHDPDFHKGDLYDGYAVLERRAVPELPPAAKKALSQAQGSD